MRSGVGNIQSYNKQGLMINAEAVRRGDAEIIENLLSEQVLDAAIEVLYELRLRNIPALSQVSIPVTYKNSSSASL
jgi:hypothetical protein